MVEGVSDIWLSRYGEKVLKVIGDFCQKNGQDAPMDVLPQQQAEPEKKLVEVLVVLIYALIEYPYPYSIPFVRG